MKKLAWVALILGVVGVSGALAADAVPADDGDCLKSVWIYPVNSGSNIGLGVVFTMMSKGEDSIWAQTAGLSMELVKRNGQREYAEVDLFGVSVGAAVAIEGWFARHSVLRFIVPPGNICAKPMDVFNSYFGVGGGFGATAWVGANADSALLVNSAGVGLYFGPSYSQGGLTAGFHADAFSIKYMRVKPRGGYYSLSRRFFGAVAIEDRVNGVRDMKW